MTTTVQPPNCIAPERVYPIRSVYAAGLSRTRLHELKKKHGIELPKFYFGKNPWARGSDIIWLLETVASLDATADANA